MVNLSAIQESNTRIHSELPPGLVAVFAGATSGIGEATLKAFVKEAVKPRVYLIGRSQHSAERIIQECKTLNAGAVVRFIQADLTLIKNVDSVCEQIKKKESSINILCLSQGAILLDWPSTYTEDVSERSSSMYQLISLVTSEKLPAMPVLVYHGRFRFVQQLLPLIRNAQHLRRVVIIAGGSKEGPIRFEDLNSFNIPLRAFRGHATSMITLSLEALAASAPDVSFVHTYPGLVQTNLGSNVRGILGTIWRFIIAIMAIFKAVPIEESGQRNLYLATSARYAAKERGPDGIEPGEGVGLARSTDGMVGNGVYSIDWDGESSPKRVEDLLRKYREDGKVEEVWNSCEAEFKRIEESYRAG